jgi:phosphinothricin acetyltransferase
MIAVAALISDHWEHVRRIHLEGIATGEATFETDTAPDWETWSGEHLEFGRFVALSDDRVVGWAALTPVSDRCVYAGVAEVSVYVGGEARGQGIGSLLMAALVDESEKHGLWTLQAGIFDGNDASVTLHEKYGFRVVGVRRRLGKLKDRWRDVLLLERRSEKIGVD